MSSYQIFYQHPLQDPNGCGAEQSCLMDWKIQPMRICDYSSPPLLAWVTGGFTNLCHNAIYRRLPSPPNATAVAYLKIEISQEKALWFFDLYSAHDASRGNVLPGHPGGWPRPKRARLHKYGIPGFARRVEILCQRAKVTLPSAKPQDCTTHLRSRSTISRCQTAFFSKSLN
jgi:hypothetical protein